MHVMFIPSKGSNNKRSIYYKSENVEIMIGNGTYQAIEDIF